MSRWSRKDYVMVAEHINDLRPPRHDCGDSSCPINGDYVSLCNVGEDTILDALAQRFAATFAADNPRFSRFRFLSACGVEETPLFI
jgi:hypothetical protein